ncbi:MAG: hypothetical protein V4478_02290 [Patescibacteria group bacterium]
MSLFHTILSQLQEKIAKETTATETVAGIVSTVLGTTIAPSQITISKTTLRLKVAPTVKMVLTLRKQKLLASLQEAGVAITEIQ